MIQNRGYLVELKYSPTRKGKSALVIPLTPVALLEKKVPSHLCPIIHLDEGDFVILTQQTTTVPTRILVEPTHDLSTFSDEIIAAIDFLITGI